MTFNKVSDSREKSEIIMFSTIALALSSIICFISYKTDQLNLSILTVFTPSIVAFIMTALSKGKIGLFDLFIKQTVRKTKFKWLLLSLIGIPALAVLAVIVSLNFDIALFGLRTTQLLPQVIVIILIALGEEYGWRGFLLPRLMNRYSVFNSSLILGLIWGIWHFPAYMIGTGVPLQMPFTVFLLWVVLGTIFISWIYYYTKSVFTSILAHIGANAAFNYLPLLPEFTGSMKAFWIFVVMLSVLLTTVYLLKRNELV